MELATDLGSAYFALTTSHRRDMNLFPGFDGCVPLGSHAANAVRYLMEQEMLEHHLLPYQRPDRDSQVYVDWL
jgi:hypothetical protein